MTLDAAICALLERRGEMTALQMLDVHDTAELAHVWFLSTRIYAALRDLERKGKIVCREAAGGPERGFRTRYFYSLPSSS